MRAASGNEAAAAEALRSQTRCRGLQVAALLAAHRIAEAQRVGEAAVETARAGFPDGDPIVGFAARALADALERGGDEVRAAEIRARIDPERRR